VESTFKELNLPLRRRELHVSLILNQHKQILVLQLPLHIQFDGYDLEGSIQLYHCHNGYGTRKKKIIIKSLTFEWKE